MSNKMKRIFYESSWNEAYEGMGFLSPPVPGWLIVLREEMRRKTLFDFDNGNYVVFIIKHKI